MGYTFCREVCENGRLVYKLAGMIRNKLSEMLGRRRMSIAELTRRAGISYPAARNLYSDQTRRYDAGVLERICEALDCQPGDLLEYIPERLSAADRAALEQWGRETQDLPEAEIAQVVRKALMKYRATVRR